MKSAVQSYRLKNTGLDFNIQHLDLSIQIPEITKILRTSSDSFEYFSSKKNFQMVSI